MSSSSRRESEELASLASRLCATDIVHKRDEREPLRSLSIDNAVFEAQPADRSKSSPKKGLEADAKTLHNSLVLYLS